MEEAIKKSDVLIEALPYIKSFRGKTFVVKYGGSILAEARIRKSVLEDIVFLYFTGINVVLVHGGGPNITEQLRANKIKSEFHQGIRVTGLEALRVVEQELAKLNRIITDEVKSLGAQVKGISGKEDLLYTEKKTSKVDLGFVGQVKDINKDKLREVIEKNHILILAPMGRCVQDGSVLHNINADEAASFVAGTLQAEKLVFLTNVRGVKRESHDHAEDLFISSVDEDEIKKLISGKVIAGGMVPKVLSGVKALDAGVNKVHIVDAKIPHALLLEIFTNQGIGTEIVR
jgi:acetylglutamate kinase